MVKNVVFWYFNFVNLPWPSEALFEWFRNYEPFKKVPQLEMIIVQSWNFRNQYFWQYKIINVFLIYKGCNALKGQEMDLNQSRAVGGNILGPFQGSLTNLGASGRLQSQIQAILGQILTFPDPPCQLSQIFMVWNGLYRCPTNSTTYFILNSHLLGAF